MTNPSPEQFEAALTNFLVLLQNKLDVIKSRDPRNVMHTKFELMRGPKRVRVVARDVIVATGEVRGGSAYAFIDNETGDILKPASWAAPAKHARGSIYAEDPVKCCEEHSVTYLK